MVAAAEIGWMEVALLGVRIVEVSVGISRGTIVDCRGYLGVGLGGNVGYSVGSNSS